MSNYRLYTFVNNVYMSPIQWGIQTAHVVSTMMANRNYRNREDLFQDWAGDSPTIIVCKGGILSTLSQLEAQVERLATHFDLPWASFYEDQDSLGGILTCVGILMPEKFYAASTTNNAFMSDNGVTTPDGIFYSSEAFPEKFELVSLITGAKLA